MLQSFVGKGCEERDDVLLFMMSNQARKQLHDNHHVITKVFEPVFMIGSIPCLLICMITRFVSFFSANVFKYFLEVKLNR